MALFGLDELRNLQELKQLDKLDQLQHMDKLSNLQSLDKLQNLSAMNNLHYLKQLQHMDQLHQLRMLNQLEKLQSLSQLQHMKMLKNLNQMQNLNELYRLNSLQHMENLRQLNHLQWLQQLEVMNRLSFLDKLSLLNWNALLYMFSILVPGLIFQEAISLLGPVHLSLKRVFALMASYNAINLILCISFGFSLFEQFSAQRPLYYAGWFCILILFPALLGAMIALLARVPQFGLLHEYMTGLHRQAANAWSQFLTEAENYQVVITLNNEEKLKGIFHKGEPTPKIDDPSGLYFKETEHYDPQSRQWEALAQPVKTWVKGSEIKIVELSTQA